MADKQPDFQALQNNLNVAEAYTVALQNMINSAEISDEQLKKLSAELLAMTNGLLNKHEENYKLNNEKKTAPAETNPENLLPGIDAALKIKKIHTPRSYAAARLSNAVLAVAKYNDGAEPLQGILQNYNITLPPVQQTTVPMKSMEQWQKEFTNESLPVDEALVLAAAINARRDRREAEWKALNPRRPVLDVRRDAEIRQYQRQNNQNPPQMIGKDLAKDLEERYFNKHMDITGLRKDSYNDTRKPDNKLIKEELFAAALFAENFQPQEVEEVKTLAKKMWAQRVESRKQGLTQEGFGETLEQTVAARAAMDARMEIYATAPSGNFWGAVNEKSQDKEKAKARELFTRYMESVKGDDQELAKEAQLKLASQSAARLSDEHYMGALSYSGALLGSPDTSVRAAQLEKKTEEYKKLFAATDNGEWKANRLLRELHDQQWNMAREPQFRGAMDDAYWRKSWDSVKGFSSEKKIAFFAKEAAVIALDLPPNRLVTIEKEFQQNFIKPPVVVVAAEKEEPIAKVADTVAKQKVKKPQAASLQDQDIGHQRATLHYFFATYAETVGMNKGQKEAWENSFDKIKDTKVLGDNLKSWEKGARLVAKCQEEFFNRLELRDKKDAQKQIAWEKFLENHPKIASGISNNAGIEKVKNTLASANREEEAKQAKAILDVAQKYLTDNTHPMVSAFISALPRIILPPKGRG